MTPDDKRRINNLAVRAALRSLANTQRVLAGTYRQWAREEARELEQMQHRWFATPGEREEAIEMTTGRRRLYASEARRLFRDAQWNINHARIYHG